MNMNNGLTTNTCHMFLNFSLYSHLGYAHIHIRYKNRHYELRHKPINPRTYDNEYYTSTTYFEIPPGLQKNQNTSISPALALRVREALFWIISSSLMYSASLLKEPWLKSSRQLQWAPVSSEPCCRIYKRDNVRIMLPQKPNDSQESPLREPQLWRIAEACC